MSVEKVRKIAFGCNIGAIGFIAGMGLAMGINGNLNLGAVAIYAVLIAANAICAKMQW